MKRPNLSERLTSNDRAVSPVIGVILMVAITVILAAVIGTFVLDLGQSAGKSAPSASLTVDTDASSETFEVNHGGGDPLQTDSTQIQITNESSGDTMTWTPNGSASLSVGGTATVDVGTETVSVGDSTPYKQADQTGTLFGGSGNIVSGMQYEVQLIDTNSQRVIFETTVTA